MTINQVGNQGSLNICFVYLDPYFHTGIPCYFPDTRVRLLSSVIIKPYFV